MQSTSTTPDAVNITAQRAAGHFHAHQQRVFKSTDRLFAALMAVQWMAGIAAALWISPRTWTGQYSQTHLHVYAAIFLGGAISLFPIILALVRPGQVSTRFVIAVGQMLISGLLIHLTGGRIETHFHLFGSLAFLAFYRDWRVLIPATIVTALDHLIRGAFWPQSLYGVLSASEWRWIEHLGWVLFIDIFLFISCRRGAKELWSIAERQAGLEMVNERIEQQVLERTTDLKASEQRFRLLSAAAPIGIFQMDVEGHCIYTNAHWQALSGLTLEESLGEGWLSALHPEDRQPVFTKWADTIQDCTEFVDEFRFVNKQGKVHWVDTRSKVSITEEGKPNGYVGTVTDITERKQTENSLRQSEERFRTIIEKMTEDYWEVDLKGSFTFFNDQVAVSHRRSRAELLGCNSSQFMDEETAQRVGKVFKQVYHSGEPVKGVLYEMSRGDGTMWFGESNVSLMMDSEGKPMGFSGISRDVTERMRTEAELRQAKEAAEAASKAKSEFLANMSHEIRTPMNGIIGMTDLTLDTELTIEQREYLEMIRISAESLLTVINDILDFSKIEAGKLSLDSVAFDLRQCIEEIMKTLALRAREKGLPLACQVLPEVPETVVGDPARLRQILVNLVGNAIKFTQQGEVVVEVSTEAQSDEQVSLHFTVRDTGIGIPEDKQAHIFDAFTQADGSTTRQYGGTGLGLTISSQLVALMDGRLWVESAVGRGSVFHFTAQFGAQVSGVERLPLSIPADFIDLPHTPAIRSASIENSRSLRILLAEDNVVNQRLAIRLLEKRGHAVVVASNGREAVSALNGGGFDLALMDIQMPEMSGLEVTAKIRERERATGERLPIIAMTAYAMKGDRERCLDAGMDGYISKPIQAAELFKVIAELTPGKPAAPTEQPAEVFDQAAALLLAEGVAHIAADSLKQ